jgi:uncharacterized membrane protein
VSLLVRDSLVLLALSLLTVGLIAGRGRMGQRQIRPMLWNLLLAWTPMLIALALDVAIVDRPDHVDDPIAVAGFVAVLTLFALFLPNSAYLITELAHLRDADDRIPIWYDVVTVLSLTMCGLLLCCISLAFVQLVLDRSAVGQAWSWVIVAACLVLANFGTFLGRRLRFNSWDAITHPRRVVTATARYVLEGRRAAEAVAYTVAFTTFTVCVYLVVALPLLHA